MIETYEYYSQLSLYSAIVVYSLAFIFAVVDLANRAGDAAETGRSSRSRSIGFSLMVLGCVFHLAATVLRGLEGQRLPWANMYEFALTGTLAMMMVYLLANTITNVRFLGSLVSGLVIVFLMGARVNFYVPVSPLPAALDSYWLLIHIVVAVLAVGFLTLSFGLSVAQLLQARCERLGSAQSSIEATQGSTEAKPGRLAIVMSKFPSALSLENLAYRMTIIGFVLWTFTLIAGSIWAWHAWGRYWGWDTKEVWTFVIWVLYAGYIHARATHGWRGTRSAWLSIIAYAAVLFNFTAVNLLFKGLHAYSGL